MNSLLTFNDRPSPAARIRRPAAARPTLAALAVLTVAMAAACGGGREATWPTRAELAAVVQTGAHADAPALRAEVIRLAGRSDAPELAPLAGEAAGDPSPLVRAAALEVQLRRGDCEAVDEALLERLANGSNAERRTALDLVLRYGDTDLQSAVVERSLRHSNAEFRAYAFRRVVMAPGAPHLVSRETLARALDGDDPVVAAGVVERLSQSGAGGALHRVHERLTSEDPAERDAALRILTDVRSLDAWPTLRWLHQHGSESERTLAGLALARIGQRDTTDEVMGVIRTGDVSLTHLALRALAGLSGDEVLGQLRAHREDTRAEVRAAALHAAVTLGRPPGDLLPFVDDPDPSVADAAALELLRADRDALAAAVCPDLLLRPNPLPLLQLVWRLWTDRSSDELLRACAPQLERLMTAESGDVRGLAARLHFQIAGATPAAAQAAADDPPVLYALLEASLGRDADAFRPVYRAALDHALYAVRVAAAVGLLETTP